MTMRKSLLQPLPKFTAAIGLALAAVNVQAADRDAGAKIYSAQCASCHGADAKSPTDPSYPILAGQYADYLAIALLKYQTGERRNAIMAALAKPLSRRDIQNISAYLQSLDGPLSHRR
jgi:cytochrome c553